MSLHSTVLDTYHRAMEAAYHEGDIDVRLSSVLRKELEDTVNFGRNFLDDNDRVSKYMGVRVAGTCYDEEIAVFTVKRGPEILTYTVGAE